MNNRILSASFVLLFAIMACNLPAGNSSTPAPIITDTPAQPLDTAVPTLTPIPTDTPFPTPTATPTIPIAWPLDKGVNCRFGPGLEWATVGSLLVGQNATIQGKNGDSSWWFVTTPNDSGKPCWVAASVTVTAGNLLNLPIVNAPYASVTKVSVKLDPNEINLPGCIGPVQPITVKGTIETNGPVKVKYYFKTEQSGDQPINEINFNSADSKNVEFNYTPPAGPDGTYWIRLIIVGPNDLVGEAKYKIKC